MKQINPIKPVKLDLKIWVRADSHNGYVCEFECYTGRKDDGTVEKGIGGSVVTKLTKDLWGSLIIYLRTTFFIHFFISQFIIRDFLLYGYSKK